MKHKLKLSEKQTEFIRALQSQKYKYMLWGGAVKGGKSALGAIIFLNFAYNQPKTRYGVFRKSRTVLKRTTYKVFKKMAALYGINYRENQSDLVWYFDNGSEIHFLEADIGKDPDLNKLRGLDLTAAMIDECNEVHEQVFNVLMSRVGTVNFNKEFPLIFLTCNPSQTWVKRRFYDPWVDDKLEAPYYYMPALPQDNPWNTPEYIESLNSLPDREKQIYVMGNWHYSDDPEQLISYEWIKSCLIDELPEFNQEIISIGVDVARMGDDSTVFAILRDDVLSNMKKYSKQDTVATSNKLIDFLKDQDVGYENVAIDSVGLGAGVVDNLYAQGYKVRPVNVGEKATRNKKLFSFTNLRAQLFWELREAFENSEIKIYNTTWTTNLINELLQIRYGTDSSKYFIEAKKEMKKRLGHSPDMSDALALAYFMRNNRHGRIDSITKRDLIVKQEDVGVIRETEDTPPPELLIETDNLINMKF